MGCYGSPFLVMLTGALVQYAIQQTVRNYYTE
jgi:hypothetical protein